MSMRYTKLTQAALAGLLTLGIAGCETNTGNGALIGGAGGAAVGGLIGSMSHARAGEGALIGGAIGAVGGALVGNEMDKQERRERYYQPDYRYYEDRPRVDPRPEYYERDTYDSGPTYERRTYESSRP